MNCCTIRIPLICLQKLMATIFVYHFWTAANVFCLYVFFSILLGIFYICIIVYKWCQRYIYCPRNLWNGATKYGDRISTPWYWHFIGQQFEGCRSSLHGLKNCYSSISKVGTHLFQIGNYWSRWLLGWTRWLLDAISPNWSSNNTLGQINKFTGGQSITFSCVPMHIGNGPTTKKCRQKW